MATKKRGLLTLSGEWARHLRPFWRRLFWRGERRAVRRDIRSQLTELQIKKDPS